MKNKIFIPFIALFVAALLFGTAYSAFVIDSPVHSGDTTVSTEVTTWEYEHDADFARFDNVKNCNYLSLSSETEIFSSSTEAVRLTNMSEDQNKAHTFDIRFDRTYQLKEIKFHKIEFDYYHAEKRQQVGKGYPKAQLVYNNSTRGNNLGGGDTIDERATFVSTDINGGTWWHLEYFITALCPTTVAHGDTGINETTNINGVRITDDNIYDYDVEVEGVTVRKTAFVVVDNFRLSTAPSSRLGLWNRTTSVTVGGYYWIKVAFAGVLEEANWPAINDVTMTYTSTDGGEVEQDRSSFATLFYIKGVHAGHVVVTVTVRTANGETRSIETKKLTVS